MIRAARVKRSVDDSKTSPDEKSNENVLKNNLFYKSKNAEQVEWWIKVEGHFNFDTFGFIEDVLDIRKRYFLSDSSYEQFKKKSFMDQVKDAFSYFADDSDFHLEKKLQVIVKDYNKLFQGVSDRNKNMMLFLKENYHINTHNWPDCVNYKNYSGVLDKAFPGFSKNTNSQEDDQSWPLCMTNYINPKNIKNSKSLWIVVESISVVGNTDATQSLLLNDSVNPTEKESELINNGKIKGDKCYRRIDLSKNKAWLNGARLRFTLKSTGFQNDSGNSVKEIDIGAFEGEHFYVVNMGKIAITISCFFSSSTEQDV